MRQEARSAMANNWGVGIGITVVFWLISGVSGLAGYGIPAIFITFPLTFGLAITFLQFVRDGKPLDVGSIFAGFKSPFYWKGVGVYLLIYIYTLLWSLLLVVPGVIKFLSYSLAPYILADEPELTAEQAICKSMIMMEGHKTQLFLIHLELFCFTLLSSCLLFIPMLWVVPWYQAIFAKFYEEVKGEQSVA